VLLESVPARAGQSDHFANGDASVFARILDDFCRELRHGRQDNSFPLDFLSQSFHLLLKSAQEKQDPWLPVRFVGSDCFLRLTQRKVVAFLAVFNDDFQ